MHIISWWQELLPYLKSGKGMLQKYDHERQYLVDVLLLISTVALASFAIVHYMHFDYRVATFQAVLAVIYTACLLLPEKKVSVATKEYVILLGTIVLFLVLIASGGIANTGIYWVPFLPFMIFAIVGLRKGVWWIALFILGFLGIILLDILHIFETPYSAAKLGYFLVAFLFYVLAASVLEGVRLRQQMDMEKNNHLLEHMREELNTTLENLEKQVEDRTVELKMSNKRLLQEISAHKITNTSLTNTQEQFYQAQKMESLGTLVGGISHDFNNMLSGINANLFLIQRQTKAMPKVQVKLDDIEKLVFHAADMIKQLLTFARKDNVEMKTFDMSPFISEAIKLAEVSLPPRIRLQQNLCGKALPMQGNATQLQQVMMNLINNARDALSGFEKPVIQVRLERFCDALEARKQHPDLQGEWIYLSVSDNGSGIDADKVEHVFEPFFSTKKVGEGTGLGLAMCYGAIQSHGGVVEVDSEIGKGTSFHIYLPLGEVKSIAAPVNSVGSSLVGEGETILLVDDDASLRDAHHDVLETLGYKVIEACNGLEAIKIYAEQGEHIDLVIMDIMMPEMGGMKAAQHILTMNDAVNIFFATGYDKENSTERLNLEDQAQLDAIKRLKKPFTVEVLSKLIRQELQR